MGNNRCKIIKIEDYFTNGIFNKKEINECLDRQLSDLRSSIREGNFNFIVVEIEGGKTLYINKFTHVGLTTGNFKVYAIELHQPLNVCMKYNVNRRSPKEVREIIEDIGKFPTATRLTLLDPSFLLKSRTSSFVFERPPPLQPPPLTVQAVPADPLPPVEVPTPAIIATRESDLVQNLAQILQNESVMKLLQNLNTQQPEMSVPPPQQMQPNQQPFMANQNFQNIQPPPNFNNQNFQNQQNFNNRSQNFQNKENFNFNNNSSYQQQEPTYDNVPTFTPGKIVDYKHVHMQTFEEQLMEFKIFRVIDYKHQTSPFLREWLREIDTDKIIEKRKAVALRKKILEYLKNAERPEDTVSNPKYPRNWEEVKLARPKPKNKRKKKLTTKIVRVIARQSQEIDWKQGYENKQPMELEAISSDEEMDVDVKPIIKVKTNLKLFVDEFKDFPKTTPEFNHFNHQNVVDIRELLWLPGRSSRPAKIMIILRGAPGSGKSHLAKLIKMKEEKFVKNELRVISIHDFQCLDIEDEDDGIEYDDQMIDNYLIQMVKFVKRTIDEKRFKFIVVDAELCDLSKYEDFYSAGVAGGFAVFTIELYQQFDICFAQLSSKKSNGDVHRAMEKLEKNRIPDDHVLVIPTALYVEFHCLENTKLKGSSKSEKMSIDPPKTSLKIQSTKIDSQIPDFNWHQRQTVDILDILDGTEKQKNVMFILRGPAGVGKTHLAGLIRNKEIENGNGDKVMILSIDDYFINPNTMNFEYSQKELEKNMEAMLKSLRDIIRKKSHNFIIIDAENGAINDYKQFYDVGKSYGFICFTIELYNDPHECHQNNIHGRSIEDIESVLEDMKLNPIPEENVLVDPTKLYENFSQSKENFHDEFLKRLKQRVMVQGEFIQKNVEPPSNLPEFNWFNRDDIIDIRKILEEPERPQKILILLRGVPGSGKTFLANLIERKEAENGNREQFKLLTIDEYFETEEVREYEKDGVKCQEKYRKYEFDLSMMENYMEKLLKSFEEIAAKNVFKFIVVDADFCDLKFYNKFYEIAQSKNFSCFTIELNQDDGVCLQFNDHKRENDEILAKNKLMQTIQTPIDHKLLDPDYLYEEYQYELDDQPEFDDEMDVEEILSDDDDEERVDFGPLKKSAVKSKWDDLEHDASGIVIERLDGTKNKKFERVTMAEYLQTNDEWTMRPSASGKKRVRWADIEEKKEQQRMREVGFIVGQTDWNRMTDTSDGRSALERTKYIEPRKK
jgi:predicted kinase